MIENRSGAELRGRLDRLPDAKPALRLVVALNYKHGSSVPEIATMYGISERTVYNWLHRLESGPLEEAIHDRARPGRPPKLSPRQRSELEAALDAPPAEAGFSATEWTTGLVAEFVDREFGVEFSSRHTRRLVNDLTGG